MRYRWAKVPGATYFFTVNLAERKRTLLVDRIDDLRCAVRKVLNDHPFRIDAIVVLPDRSGRCQRTTRIFPRAGL